jgi:hypothetical protein
MQLTDEKLAEIKAKIETDKVRPIRVIRELYPDADFQEIRKQLFDKYGAQELLSHMPQPEPPPEPTTEEKIAQIDEQLARMEQRKARLLEEKVKLQG